MASFLLIVAVILILVGFWYTLNIGYKDMIESDKKPENKQEEIPVAPILTQAEPPAKEKKPRKPRAKKTS